MLEVRGIRKRFGSVEAVRGVSFEVATGERFGLLGPNGAGKTTTISMITGTMDPDAGEIRLDGQPVGTRRLLAKRGVGYVPQEIALYEDLNSLANLQFFGSLYGLGGEELARSIDRVLEIAGLRDRAAEPVRTFSGGMKRRLNIAAALLHDPTLIVLDEPTVGVDPQSRNAIFDALMALASEGKTLLYTTHYMEEVERLCQRVAVMDHGEIVACGTLAELNRELAAGERVVVSLSAPVSVTELPGAQRLAAEEGGLTFDVEDLTRDLPIALAALRDAGARVTSVRTSSTSLEDVFLHLTGRTLRD